MDAVKRGTAPATMLQVRGELPGGLDGCFLQVAPHPRSGAVCGGAVTGPPAFSGVRLGGGAHLYRERLAARPGEPLGPVPALAPSLWLADPRTPDGPSTASLARPVRDAASGRWHTVATYPGLDYAEHLTAAPDGSLLRAEPFTLPGAPLLHAVALTRRFVVVLDLPVCHSRAAELIGARLPYTWRSGRPARIGLLPRRSRDPWAGPRWFAVEPCYVFQAVNAYESGDEVVLDAFRHERAFTGVPEAGRPRLHRWVLDLARGTARARDLDPGEGLQSGLVDERVRGRRHRYLFGTVDAGPGGGLLVRHDLETGTARAAAPGAGWRFGDPVLAPDARRSGEGTGWILVVARHAGGACELRVYDAADPAAGPAAAVRLTAGLAPGARTTWLPGA